MRLPYITIDKTSRWATLKEVSVELKQEIVIERLPVQPSGEVQTALTKYHNSDINSRNPE